MSPPSTTCAASRTGACPAACSATWTAAPRTSSRCARNVDGFAALEFRPRVLRDVGKIDTSCSLFGRPLPLPLILAPTGFTRIVAPDGELAVSRAAAAADLPYTLSTMSTCSIEEVAAASDGPKWFQVYVWRDRGLVKDMLQRAGVVRLPGNHDHGRHRGARSTRARRARRVHDAAATRAGDVDRRCVASGVDVGVRPVRSDHVRQRRRPRRQMRCRCRATSAEQFDPSLSWADIEWFRGQLGRSDHDQGHPDRRRRQARGRRTASTASPCRTTAAANSTAPRRPSNWSRR